jgi:hypothetical protein
LLTEEAVRVEAGDPVRITEWGGDAELAGLTGGDDVVVFPSDLVEDGVRVAPHRSASDDAAPD